MTSASSARSGVDSRTLVDSIRGGLVVSCQSPHGSPLRSSAVTALLAQAAVLGGAVGLRIDSPDDVRAVRAVSDVPIIGLFKVMGPRRNVITPSLEHAGALVNAGADIVAIDATVEVRDDDFDLLRQVADTFGVPVMADVSTLHEGRRALEQGAAMVGTTLSGYTPQSPAVDEPDLDLVEALVSAGAVVLAEGRYRTPEHVAAAFAAGATAVVVGGAITDPLTTTRRFVDATPLAHRG